MGAATAETAPQTRSDHSYEAYDVVSALGALNIASDRLWADLAKRLQISAVDLRALSVIATGPDVTPKDLAARLDLTSGTVTTLLDRLEAKTYVERLSHPQDRRSLLVRLTPGGDHALGWAIEHYHHAIARVLPSTPGLELEALVDFLHAAGDALHDTTERLASTR